VTNFLQDWAGPDDYLYNPRNLPEWEGVGDVGEVHLAFSSEGLSPDFHSTAHGYRAARAFLQDIEPLISRVTNITRIFMPSTFRQERDRLDLLAKAHCDLKSLLGASQSIHTGFRVLRNVQLPPTLTPLDQTGVSCYDPVFENGMLNLLPQTNYTIMTASQQGSGTGGDFLVGTRYYQFKFSPAGGALLFFRGDLLYHAGGKYQAEDDDEDYGHTTLILEPCVGMSNQRPPSTPPIQADVIKPLADDLMELSG
jgi:hypothetical protein